MVFHENDKQDVRDVEMRRALVDPGSSLHLIPLYILEPTRVSQHEIAKQPIEESHFEVIPRILLAVSILTKI